MRALILSAAQSGAGKTMITLGLLRALRARGALVAAGKSGPDYIDPGFHKAACGEASVNLDAWAMAPERLCALAAAQAGELLLVEGAMGLFDGAADGSAAGRGSTADVAAALGAPVVAVLDISHQAQTAAAIALGLARLREDVSLAGVILNRAGSPRHAEMAARAVTAAGVRVLGAVPRTKVLTTPSRHLGLVLVEEHADLEAFIEGAAELVAGHVDLEALTAAARPLQPCTPISPALAPLGSRIAIAHDPAFAFLYPHLLQGWRAAGAELTLFSPLADEAPPAHADAVFLPGGYPELHAGPLASAARFKAGMQAAAKRGAVIYGECGGYMALGEGLEDAGGCCHPMLGLLPVETSFAKRRLTLGYRLLTPVGATPWPGRLTAHEFHYSTPTREEGAPLFEAVDAAGTSLPPMGRRVGAIMGSYAHVIDAGPTMAPTAA
ncbi:MAG: cobyrinate a,c-diamide synthase [Rhodobacteraceae bacterium]|nr:cobyrinate a,c-diamide synthase [Paracoccaceae bacterium]